MATVVVLASLPSIRLGLADMLSTHGHTVVSEEEAGDTSVWVLDDPRALALDSLTAQRYSDSPRAAVILSHAPPPPTPPPPARLPGWAALARDLRADQLALP